MDILSVPFSEQKRLSKIRRVGQVDYFEPIMATIPPARSSLLAYAVSLCFPRQIVVAYEYVQIRWMKPGPSGELVPKYPPRADSR